MPAAPAAAPTAASSIVSAVCVVAIFAVVALGACKRSEPVAEPTKSQRASMERAKEVGTTMQKGVDADGRKADADGK